jgi:hypothetical protein
VESDPLHADIAAALEGGQSPDFWAKHTGPNAVAASSVSLAVEVRLPLPAPLGITAASLALIDIAYRLAVQAVETGDPVERLWETGSDGVPLPYGLRLRELRMGSGFFSSDASDRLYKALQSKPVVFASAAITALQLAGYDVQIVPDRPAPAGPAPQVQQPPAWWQQQQPGVKQALTVNGQSYDVYLRPRPPVWAREPRRPAG